MALAAVHGGRHLCASLRSLPARVWHRVIYVAPRLSPCGRRPRCNVPGVVEFRRSQRFAAVGARPSSSVCIWSPCSSVCHVHAVQGHRCVNIACWHQLFHRATSTSAAANAWEYLRRSRGGLLWDRWRHLLHRRIGIDECRLRWSASTLRARAHGCDWPIARARE